jgi:hypothetical protein
MLNEVNQIHNFMSSSGSGSVINYGSGSDFLTSYSSGSGSGSKSQKVTVPTVPVPVHQHCLQDGFLMSYYSISFPIGFYQTRCHVMETEQWTNGNQDFIQ